MKQRIEDLERLVSDLRTRVETLERGETTQALPTPAPQKAPQRNLVRTAGVGNVYTARKGSNMKMLTDEVRARIGKLNRRDNQVAVMVTFSSGARVSATGEEIDLAKQLRDENTKVALVIYHASTDRVDTPPVLESYFGRSVSIRLDATFTKARGTVQNEQEWDSLISYMTT